MAKFLKWVGSKESLIPKLIKMLPTKIEVYIEPFVGGGSLFFHIAEQQRAKQYILGDVNYALIATYTIVKKNPWSLIEVLSILEDNYLKADIDSQKQLYYQYRDKFNELLRELSKDEIRLNSKLLELGALFIVLNKTGYRGLYRVNKSNKYNTPWGKYSKPNIVNKEALLNAHSKLQEAEVYYGDYKRVEGKLSSNTFIYIDPPYVPLSQTSRFTEYGERWELKDHLKLAEWFKSLECKAMLSNSIAAKDLYAGYNVLESDVARRIKTHEKITEIIVTNYNGHKFNN